LIKENLNLVMK